MDGLAVSIQGKYWSRLFNIIENENFIRLRHPERSLRDCIKFTESNLDYSRNICQEVCALIAAC